MINGLATSLSGLAVSAHRQSIIANNLANVNTNSYKTVRPEQTESLYGGANLSSTNQIFTQGAIIPVGGSENVAIVGDGFFQVETPKGPAYTRNGSFTTDSQGFLSTTDGNRLSQNIQIPDDAEGYSIAGNGIVTAAFSDGSTEEVGQIEIASFSNQEGLIRNGGNTYGISPSSGAAQMVAPGSAGTGYVVSGVSEGSNVDMAEQIGNMIVNSANFKYNIEALKTSNEMLGELIDIMA